MDLPPQSARGAGLANIVDPVFPSVPPQIIQLWHITQKVELDQGSILEVTDLLM